jgi:hypothetical protein
MDVPVVALSFAEAVGGKKAQEGIASWVSNEAILCIVSVSDN